jgi:hypothetical protein
MINYEFTQYIPSKRYDSKAYAEEHKVIQTFLETPSFPTLKLSYPTPKSARNACASLLRHIKSHRIQLRIVQRDTDIYLVRKETEEKGEINND